METLYPGRNGKDEPLTPCPNGEPFKVGSGACLRCIHCGQGSFHAKINCTFGD